MATLDLGKIKQVWRGTYNNGTAYVVDDLVAYTDSGITSTYICVANSTGNAPSSSGTAHASWNYVAKGVVDPIPSQSGNAGKALITNGSAVSWGDGGAWTAIAKGTGPSSSVTSLNIDNIFSDTYKWYKVYLSWHQSDYLRMRFIKTSDGAAQSTSYYVVTYFANYENADGSQRNGNTNTNSAQVTSFDCSSTGISTIEMTFQNPYESGRFTGYHTNYAMTAVGSGQVIAVNGGGIYQQAESHRGLHLYANAGDNINSTNFQYLVLGAKIA